MNARRMRKTRAYRARDHHTLADPCYVAERAWDRLAGLMGEPGLAPGSGLWLAPCNSIHTCFMRFAIDAVYVDGAGRVLSVRRGMRPWRLDFPVPRSRAVLELPEGAAGDLKEGDVVCLS